MRKAALLAVAVTAVAVTGSWTTPAAAAGTCGGFAVTTQGTPGNDPDLRGTPDRDVIAGLGGADTIRGLGGDDVICGGQGNDVILGEAGFDRFVAESIPDGRDVFLGGADLDQVTYAARTAPLTISLTGSAVSGGAGEQDAVATDVENAVGGLAGDTLTGNTAENRLEGGRGVDHLFGGAFDSLYGDAGDDVISTSGPSTATSAVLGGDGNDTIAGGAMRDYFWGENGVDTLYGGGGYDVLDGGANDDSIDGRDGAGFDSLGGGPGTDTCRIDPGDHEDCER